MTAATRTGPTPAHEPTARTATASLRDDPAATAERPAARVTSVIASGAIGALAAFQLGLAVGAPWGEAAWGGASSTLAPGLRVASAVASVVWSGAALVALRQGGHESWAPVPDRWLRRVTIGLAGYTGLGVLMNLASRSELERAIWAPTSLVIAVGLGLTAAWGRPGVPLSRAGRTC